LAAAGVFIEARHGERSEAISPRVQSLSDGTTRLPPLSKAQGWPGSQQPAFIEACHCERSEAISPRVQSLSDGTTRKRGNDCPQ